MNFDCQCQFACNAQFVSLAVELQSPCERLHRSNSPESAQCPEGLPSPVQVPSAAPSSGTTPSRSSKRRSSRRYFPRTAWCWWLLLCSNRTRGLAGGWGLTYKARKTGISAFDTTIRRAFGTLYSVCEDRRLTLHTV